MKQPTRPQGIDSSMKPFQDAMNASIAKRDAMFKNRDGGRGVLQQKAQQPQEPQLPQGDSFDDQVQGKSEQVVTPPPAQPEVTPELLQREKEIHQESADRWKNFDADYEKEEQAKKDAEAQKAQEKLTYKADREAEKKAKAEEADQKYALKAAHHLSSDEPNNPYEHSATKAGVASGGGIGGLIGMGLDKANKKHQEKVTQFKQEKAQHEKDEKLAKPLLDQEKEHGRQAIKAQLEKSNVARPATTKPMTIGK